MFSALCKGFITGGSLIVAIGAQNAFVLRLGLSKQYLFMTALLCSLIDAGLILLGVAGFGSYITEHPDFLIYAKYFAVLFLGVYGFLSFKSACAAKVLDSEQLKEQTITRAKVIVLLLTFSLLNPHVYLDTVILLGTIASQQPKMHQSYFALGAASASCVWFFSLAYGSSLLAPLLKKEISWRILDCLIGATMWIIAFSLLHFM